MRTAGLQQHYWLEITLRITHAAYIDSFLLREYNLEVIWKIQDKKHLKEKKNDVGKQQCCHLSEETTRHCWCLIFKVCYNIKIIPAWQRPKQTEQVNIMWKTSAAGVISADLSSRSSALITCGSRVLSVDRCCQCPPAHRRISHHRPNTPGERGPPNVPSELSLGVGHCLSKHMA